MIRHMVMWKFKEEAEGKSRAENMAFVREQLLALPPLIPQLRSLFVAPDVLQGAASCDIALIADFDDMEALLAYIAHPAHQKVSVYVKLVTDFRMSADMEV